LQIFLILLTVGGGAAIAVQSGVNNSLNTFLKNPVLSATVSFTGGAILLIALSVITRAKIPSTEVLKSIPLWQLTGGFFGAFLVSVIIIASPKLGIAPFFAIMIAGQLITAMILDHYGLIGFSVQPINWYKILGAVFLVAGAILIKKF